MDNQGQEQPHILALREKVLEGLEPLDDFSAAVKKHSKTLKRRGVPIVYIGRSPYVPIEQGRAWLLNGCRPPEPERATRRRRV